MKRGTHTFVVDVSSHAEGPIAIEACAHQGSVRAGLVMCTDIVTVVIDRTPPEITATVTPEPNFDGWHNTDVTVTFEATDVGSGIASVTPDVVLTEDGAGQVVVGTAIDRAGNIASTSVTVDIDPTQPSPQTLFVDTAAERHRDKMSIRRALFLAEPGGVIIFDPSVFPPNNPTTITLTRTLPRLNKGSVAIDASNAGVILDGSEIPGSTYGLHLLSNNNTIRGLQIVGFSVAGIALEGGASHNVIGGDRGIGTGPLGQGNLISGNGDFGVGVWDEGTSYNTVQGNYIGINLDGTETWGHARVGIHHNGADHSLITDNVIGGNGSAGIYLSFVADGHNTVTGNTIGTDPSGETRLGNHQGILVDHSGHNVIGPGNIIAFNRGGITFWEDTPNNTVTQNSIHDNRGPGSAFDLGGLGINAIDPSDVRRVSPRILGFDLPAGSLTGLACASCIVEVFSDSDDEGRTYEGQTEADGTGFFTFSNGGAFTGPHVTTYATDPGGSTTEFSRPAQGGSRVLTFQEGNALARLRLQTKPSGDLADNRISVNVSDLWELDGETTQRILKEV